MTNLLRRLIGKPNPEDEKADHLRGSEKTPTMPRGERHRAAAERTLRLLRANGPDSAKASPALLRATETHFGSWTKALAAAGMGLGAGSVANTRRER